MFTLSRGLGFAIAVFWGLAACGDAGGPTEPGEEPVRYEMVMLPLLSGHDEGFAFGVNNRAVVVGKSCADRCSAVMWRGGEIVDLMVAPGEESEATAVNDSQVVVGFVDNLTKTFNSYPFMWEDGVTTRLPTLVEELGNEASDINASGVVVGFSTGYNGDDRNRFPVVWRDGIIERLPPPEPAAYGWAYAINDLGVVVGHAAHVGGGPRGGVRWADMSVHRLEHAAFDVNNAGSIVGAGDRVPMMWTDGISVELPLPPGASAGGGSSVNDLGEVIIEYIDAEGYHTSAVWTPELGFLNLPTPPGSVPHAQDLNNDGLVVGYIGGRGFKTRPVAWWRIPG